MMGTLILTLGVIPIEKMKKHLHPSLRVLECGKPDYHLLWISSRVRLGNCWNPKNSLHLQGCIYEFTPASSLWQTVLKSRVLLLKIFKIHVGHGCKLFSKSSIANIHRLWNKEMKQKFWIFCVERWLHLFCATSPITV